ncbi:aminodeoxychorismate lyase [Bacillus sp. JCM 19041]|uniref:aminodeoxychorismate lyase n=1 Tax=Bacillus sp. JCM 19041 TaxID=1460637 RepID=UPI0006CF6637
MYVSINGRLVHEEDAAVSVFDHGFLYGMGLFETFAVSENRIFLLDEHIDRLKEGLHSIGVDYDVTAAEVYRITSDLLSANGLTRGYVRWNVSAGVRGIGLSSQRYSEPQVIVFMKELPVPPVTKEAVILRLPRNSPEGEKRLKSHHYLNNILAKQEIGDKKAEGIFLTEQGYVAEGIVSNLFWKIGDRVYTPCLSTGILDGVTRSFVIRLIESHGYKVEQGHYTEKELYRAEDLFITNSIQGVVPISKLDDHILYTGEFAKGVSSAYAAVAKERE